MRHKFCRFLSVEQVESGPELMCVCYYGPDASPCWRLLEEAGCPVEKEQARERMYEKIAKISYDEERDVNLPGDEDVEKPRW